MENKLDTNHSSNLLNSIISLIDTTRQNVAKTVNQELTLLYWNIGKSINEDILNNERADYGKKIIPELSIKLSEMYGTGFNKRNLQSFIKLNAVFEDVTILHTLCAKLSWSHLRTIIYVESAIKRDFYIDLLFYHRCLRRLIAIDLKLGKFKASYKSQMELYLGWLEQNEQKEYENNPIGLILCSEKSPEQINYLLLDQAENIKVAEYLT